MAEQLEDKAPEPGAESDDFSEAFAERIEDPAGSRGEDKAAGDEPPAKAEEPAQAGSDDQAPAKAAAEGASGFDPFAGMTDEQRSHWERVAASDRSQRGRVSALTRKLQARESATPVVEVEAADEADDQKPDALAALREEYGDVVGPVIDEIEALRKKVSGMEASATREKEEQDTELLAAQYAQLEEEHPDWQAVAQSPEFQEWFTNQPANIQAVVNSNDAREVAIGLNLYKTELGLAEKVASGQTNDTSGTDGANGGRRRRQLEGSTHVEKRGVASSGVPDDFGAAFTERAKKPA